MLHMKAMKEWLEFLTIRTEDKSWDIGKDSMIRMKKVFFTFHFGSKAYIFMGFRGFYAILKQSNDQFNLELWNCRPI